MPRTATDYPVGTSAVYAGQLVKVHQHIDDETLLVFGPKIQRRVTAAELSPPPEATLFEQWLAERVIVPSLGTVMTPATEIMADYLAWIEARGQEANYPTTHRAFMAMMRDFGHQATRGYWREPGGRFARSRVLFKLLLKGTAQ